MKHRQEMDRLYASATKNDRCGVLYGLILVFLLANIPLPLFRWSTQLNGQSAIEHQKKQFDTSAVFGKGCCG